MPSDKPSDKITIDKLNKPSDKITIDKLNKPSDKITIDKMNKYFDISRRAFNKAKDNINPGHMEDADKILDMSKRYVSDAEFFRKKGDFVNAFAALNYAHGWLDAGSKLGIFDVDDSELFVVR